MSIPFFYIDNSHTTTTGIVLDEDNSKHIVQVLRMQNGEQLQLTDGKGSLFTCEITDNNRKRCSVKVVQVFNSQQPVSRITIAISLIKNNSRFEWFLEKAAEIGVTEIIPLICERTEKTAFKYERLNSILISAMLQSQQTFLPLLHQPLKFNEAIYGATQQLKFIAHCEDEQSKIQLTAQHLTASTSKLILIGPEGDFTKKEIDLAIQTKFVPVALGGTRLRTETAGIVAAAILRLF